MTIKVKNGQIILVADTHENPALLAALRVFDGHAVSVQVRSDVCLVLEDLGPHAEACREPINVTRNIDSCYAPISNLYPTPFLLDDEAYGSVEGFWQSLKHESPTRRREIAALSGTAAKKAGGHSSTSPTFEYLGKAVRTGTYDHWVLMKRACEAKFSQNEKARRALLATGSRPLTHIVRGDSRTIPGVIMASIWMRIRREIQNVQSPER